MSNNTNLSVQLNQPFPYEAYGVNYEGVAYIGVQWVVDRLNEVVGPLNWRHEFFDVVENMEDHSVELIGRLSIWDEAKQTWMERTNYGNDTMTILREASEPTAQDRMDCKKSAVSDSLKKCAAWFGVASDVFKGFIDVIKPQKFDGTNNPLYNRLVSAFSFVDPYGLHRYGIPILPDSYREYYQEKGWQGIFKSDIWGRGMGNNESDSAGKSNPSGSTRPSSDEQPNNVKTGSGSRSSENARSGNGAGSSRSGSSRSSNKPTNFRMKVLDAPKFNQDGSATFRARLESGINVTVFAGKDMMDEVRKIQPNLVVKTSGWIREDQYKVTLASKVGKIDIEAA